MLCRRSVPNSSCRRRSSRLLMRRTCQIPSCYERTDERSVLKTPPTNLRIDFGAGQYGNWTPPSWITRVWRL